MASEGAPGVRTFKGGQVRMVAYLVAHESHQRGNIRLTLEAVRPPARLQDTLRHNGAGTESELIKSVQKLLLAYSIRIFDLLAEYFLSDFENCRSIRVAVVRERLSGALPPIFPSSTGRATFAAARLRPARRSAANATSSVEPGARLTGNGWQARESGSLQLPERDIAAGASPETVGPARLEMTAGLAAISPLTPPPPAGKERDRGDSSPPPLPAAGLASFGVTASVVGSGAR